MLIFEKRLAVKKQINLTVIAKTTIMKYVFLILIILVGSSVYAQVDDSKLKKNDKHIGERHIGKKIKKIGEIRHIGKGFKIDDNSKNIFGLPNKVSFDIKKDNQGVDMTKQKQFVTPRVNINPNYLRRKEGRVKEEYSQPQDLGTYRTKGKFVIISWRDSQVVDGDRVNIIVNDTVVARNVTLLGNYSRLRVNLGNGFTKVKIRALNQGESGPNTADFKVVDEYGKVLTHDLWNLTTGTIAHLLIIKD